MKLVIVEYPQSGDPLPVCVHDRDTTFGDTVGRFRTRRDAEIFKVAKLADEVYLSKTRVDVVIDKWQKKIDNAKADLMMVGVDAGDGMLADAIAKMVAGDLPDSKVS